MKNLFEAQTAEEIKGRVAALRPDSERQWGKMSVGQTVQHCCRGIQSATGELVVERVLIGRLIGPMVKRMVLGNDKPFGRDSPTAKEFLVHGEPELALEQERLVGLIDRFAAAGPAGCTTRPHAFFGKLTPEEWSELMYKHLDHHLRQFGV